MSEIHAARGAANSAVSRAASRSWWDSDADDYQAEHGEFLGDTELRWCPEGLTESEAGLLGPVAGRRILEIGCGAASSARWLLSRGAEVIASDLSAGMLRHARTINVRTGLDVPLAFADAEALPFASGAFDIVFTAFGAVPFVADSGLVMREAARVLRPGGRWVFSVTHPMRWIFPDDPGEAGLIAINSYFDRRPYVEYTDGKPSYVEHHRTLGDRVREINAAGLVLRDLVEPEWPEGHTQEWGQWSPARGKIFPGTAIYVTEKPA
ncbi:class I SAM-dependent methyltransferase [Longispora albida]|uniref:class I SAM-dependent methyltransferase n=1 Tax=Longispora albida TaxID=203523 RepID=UPI00037919A1|nr:class I SAM-dependent methyltransferase [Longispora albida]